jgi:hypothetical protein
VRDVHDEVASPLHQLRETLAVLPIAMHARIVMDRVEVIEVALAPRCSLERGV